MPPEDRYCPEKATVWSLGVLLYELVYHRLPYESEPDERKLTFDLDTDFVVSEELKDLIRKCLTVEVNDRPKLETVAKHPWVL